MEQFLLRGVEMQETMLGEVTKAIEEVEKFTLLTPVEYEESVFELLRAAG